MGGYISNFRLLKVTALYTGATYTVPTAPLSVIANTSLLTCQSNRFIDNSTNNFTITRNGDASVQTFSPFAPSIITPTSYSGYFDGNGDYLSGPQNAAFAFGTGSFTVEFFVYTISTTAQMVFDTLQPNTPGGGSNRFYVYIKSDQKIVTGPATQELTSTGTIQLGAWTHVAVVRNGTSRIIYINGVANGSDTFNNNLTENYCTIGFDAATNGTIIINGYLSNLRVVKGTAVYTSAFTSPTSPLTAISGTSLLTCESNRFIDNSTNNFTITVNGNSIPRQFNPFGNTSTTGTNSVYGITTVGGSVYFNGTNNYLLVPDNTALESFNDFTIEFWVYFTSVSTAQIIVDKGWNNGGGYSPYFILLSGGNLLAYASSSGTVNDVLSGASFGAMVAGQWYHIALTRSGSAIKLFTNGAVITSATNSSTLMSNSTNLGVGSVPLTGAFLLNGYLSNLRIIKGSAAYTSAFAPPVAPLTSIANTTLLLNGTNSGLVDYTSKNLLETVGDAKLSTAITKFGNASMSFDGSGDYLIIAAAEGNRINTTGNFTIEFWAYFNSVASDQRLIGWDNATNNFVIAIYTGSTGVLNYYLSSSGTSWNIAQQISMGNIATNTWYHVALVRNGSVFTPYLNGVAGTTTTSSATLTTSTLPFSIGAVSNGTSPFNGYIDDFRITKGYARYTANFTPPTTAFLTY
jgi:hypothetical protein